MRAFQRPRSFLSALRADERGVTLTELAVAMLVTGIMAAAFIAIMLSVNQMVIGETERSTNNDQARLAVEQLDREIRSGNILYDPAAEAVPDYSLRIYTQANATTRTPSYQCVQWVLEDRQLLRRFWPPGNPAAVSGWRTIADGLVNVDEGVPAFALDPEPVRGGRTLDVVFLVNNRLEQRGEQTIRIQTSITGRNTTFGFSPTSCTPAPTI